MNGPLLQCILIALVGAELAFSHGSKSLAEDKAGEMSDKIKAASHRRSLLHRLAGRHWTPLDKDGNPWTPTLPPIWVDGWTPPPNWVDKDYAYMGGDPTIRITDLSGACRTVGDLCNSHESCCTKTCAHALAYGMRYNRYRSYNVCVHDYEKGEDWDVLFKKHGWTTSQTQEDAQKGTEPAPSLAIAAPEDVNKCAQSTDDPAIGDGGSCL